MTTGPANRAGRNHMGSAWRRPWDRASPALGRAGLVALAGLALLPAAGVGAAKLSPGDIVVVDGGGSGRAGAVLRVDPVSGEQTTVSSGGLFATPFGVALESDGDIVVADPRAFGGRGAVIRVDPVSGAQTAISSGGSLVFPTGVAVEADGDILIAEPEDFSGLPAGRVIRVDPVSGEQTTVSSGGSFATPVGVTLEADGDILVADINAFGEGRGGVIRVDPVSGAQTTVSSSGSFVDPFGVAVEADGDILVADIHFEMRGGVFRVDPVSGAQTLLSSTGSFVDPFGVAVEADGGILIADSAAFPDLTGGVIRVDPGTGAQTRVSSGGSFANPHGLAVVPSAPPVANSDAYTTAARTPLSVAAPGVLANDADTDGQTLSAAPVSGPAHGTLTLNTDGSFTYTPAAGYQGPDAFTYTANDGQTVSSPATATLTVTPPPPPPADAAMRLQAPALSVFARSRSQAHCRMSTGRIRTCSVRLRAGRRVLATGSAAATGAGRRDLTVTLNLTRSGRKLLTHRLGGVRVRMHADATTSGGARTATARTRAILRVEHFRTPAGSWLASRAQLTARGRSFLRGLRGKLIAVAGLRCDGHDADARPDRVTETRLSLARASMICHALTRVGVRARPRLAGHGDSQPITSNATKTGRAKNRRVEITITHSRRRR